MSELSVALDVLGVVTMAIGITGILLWAAWKIACL